MSALRKSIRLHEAIYWVALWDGKIQKAIGHWREAARLYRVLETITS